MKRRTLLATTGAGVAGFWYVSKRSLEENVYVECDSEYVPYHRLPDEVTAEVDAALEDGSYETEAVLHYGRAVADGTTLWRGDSFYEHRIDGDGETTVLTFEETNPSPESPVEVVLENETGDTLEIRVTAADGGDEVVLDETVIAEPTADAEPEDELPAVDLPAAFGSYEITIRIEDEGRIYTRAGVVVDPAVVDVRATVTADDVEWTRNLDETVDAPCSGGWWGDPEVA